MENESDSSPQTSLLVYSSDPLSFFSLQEYCDMILTDGFFFSMRV